MYKKGNKITFFFSKWALSDLIKFRMVAISPKIPIRELQRYGSCYKMPNFSKYALPISFKLQWKSRVKNYDLENCNWFELNTIYGLMTLGKPV